MNSVCGQAHALCVLNVTNPPISLSSVGAMTFHDQTCKMLEANLRRLIVFVEPMQQKIAHDRACTQDIGHGSLSLELQSASSCTALVRRMMVHLRGWVSRSQGVQTLVKNAFGCSFIVAHGLVALVLSRRDTGWVGWKFPSEHGLRYAAKNELPSDRNRGA
ncbi:hypothetical protein BJ546DRAFT_101998 [Cryomyces antarcticus]